MAISIAADQTGLSGTIDINGVPKLRIHDTGYLKTPAGVTISTDKGLLGTCAQSGGIITGSILEYGTNSIGGYARFASGALIQYFKGTTGPYGTQTFTLPSGFIDTKYGISAIVQHNTQYNIGIGIWNIDTTYFTLSFVATATNGTSAFLGANYAVNISCIGRWF